MAALNPITTSAAVQIQHEFYDRLMESQYAPRDSIVAWQRKQLTKLLIHARTHVPFYAKRLEAVFKGDREIDWAAWQQLPTVKREDLVDHRLAMLSQALPASQGTVRKVRSGGSTGKPVSVDQSDYSNVMNRALIFRGHGWHGMDWSKPFLLWFGDELERGGLDWAQPRPKWGPLWLDRAGGEQLELNRRVHPSDVLRFMGDHNVTYLSSRPIAAQVLASEALRLQRTRDLGLVLTFGTGAGSAERSECWAAFNAPIVAPYASKEAQSIAYPCPTGDHYHVNEEAVLVEVVDDDGHAVEEGQTGRVLVTPFYNYAQPLIRYEQSDLAVAGPPCECGRSLQVLQRIVGREQQLFAFPDGSKVSLSLSGLLLEAFGARQWQVAQTDPRSVEVRYVRADRGTWNEEPIRAAIMAQVPSFVAITFREVSELRTTPSGKLMLYANETSGGS